MKWLIKNLINYVIQYSHQLFFSYLSTFGDKKLSHFFVIFFAFISEVVFLDSGFGDSEIFPTLVTLRPQSVLSFKAQTSDCRWVNTDWRCLESHGIIHGLYSPSGANAKFSAILAAASKVKNVFFIHLSSGTIFNATRKQCRTEKKNHEDKTTDNYCICLC